MSLKRNLAGCLILFLTMVIVRGQVNYNFEHINENSSASFGLVNNIYQDTSGVMWLGVFGKGLEYYLGEKIRRFPIPNEGQFSDRNDVFIESRGLLYLNFGHSVKVFDPIRQIFIDSFPLSQDLKQRGEITLVAFNEKENQLWAIFEGHGTSDGSYKLLRVQDGIFSTVSSEKLSTRGTPFLKILDEGVLIKLNSKLAKTNGKGEVIRTFELKEIEMEILNQKNFVLDEAGFGWFAKSVKGVNTSMETIVQLWRLNTQTSKVELSVHQDMAVYNSKFNSNGFPISRLFKSQDKIFINGQLYFDEKEKELINLAYACGFDSTSGPSVGQIYSVLVMENGTIFLGGTNGLGKMVPKPNCFEQIPLISTRSLVEDENGMIYGGNYYENYGNCGINKYNPETNTVKSFARDVYWYKAFYNASKIYFGDKIFDVNTFKISDFNYSKEPKLNEGTISNLLVKSNQLWQTSWMQSNIFMYDLGSRRQIKSIHIPELAKVSVDINDLYQSPSTGNVWVGTFGKGVFVFSEEGERLFSLNTANTNPIQLKNNNVSSFYEDREGNMWMGQAGGICKIHPKIDSLEYFTIDKENPEFYLVYGILPEDDDRFLWLSTNQGVFRFDALEKTFLDFPLNPEVMNVEYNRTGYLKARNGKMYFTGNNVYNKNLAFFPNQVMEYYGEQLSSEAKVLISEFSWFNHEKAEVESLETGLQNLDRIVLQPGDRFFSLNFHASDFRQPKYNYYSFFLEGYEEDWNTPSRSQNLVRFENLPPGEYQLKMRASLFLKDLPKNERVILVSVLPFWYQTIWAKILFACIILVSFFGFYRYRLQRQFEHQEAVRLQDLGALKSRLYTNITHEFRTPITVILGMNDNIQGHEKEKDLIRRNAKNLQHLINQLLDLSKLDSGTIKVNKVQGNIIAYLQYLTESFYSMANDKKVSLTFKSEVKSCIMDFDELKVQHVLYNLLSNAIKFTQSGGKVFLESDVEEKDGSKFLKIRVRDTGMGIPKEELPRIFDRFYQVNQKGPNAQQAFSGTGIGLALCKELIELMEGTIDVKSELDWGTTFLISLPVKTTLNTPVLETELFKKPVDISPEKQTETSIPVFDFKENGKPHLLLVEDNPGVVAYVVSLLEKDYQISVGINGMEGMEMALEIIPDIIITDVMMPEKDGMELCKELKSDIRTSHIPIIMLTAKANQQSKIEGLEMGADAYLSKPFEKEELMVRLRKLLELRFRLQAHFNKVGPLDLPVLDEPEEFQIENNFLQGLNEKLEKRISDAEMTIPEMCQMVQMSHTQLYRKLKALTGKTPSQYLRSVRLEKGKELLKNSELNISEIAYDVGFSDPNYFTKMFKEEFGMVPGEFRNGAKF